MEYISPAPAVIQSPTPVVEFLAPASAVIQSATPVEEKIAPSPAVIQASTPVVENIALVPAVLQAPTPVMEYVAPAPAVIQAPTPVVENIAPALALYPCPQRVKHQRQWFGFLLPRQRVIVALVAACSHCALHLSWNSSRLSPYTVFLSLSHQRLQMQRHASRLSLAPRAERASRFRRVRRDAVLWTTPGTCLTCRWNGSCVLLWRCLGYDGDARKGERNSWRILCYTSVMSCSRALVRAYGDFVGVAGGMPWSDPCSFCDRWCGHSGGLLGAQCRVP